MKFNILDISRAINGRFLGSHDEDVIEFLSTDSRNVIFEEQTLFIALPGSRKNGHDFIDELKTRGVRNFLVSDQRYVIAKDKYNYIVVPNTIVALQSLAAFHRSRFSYPVMGITGSNGKTIVKEWLAQLLSKHFRIVRSPKSYNSQIGVPLSVWQMNTEHNLAIFEAGISQKGEMQALEKIIKPDIGIFTYLGDAHSAGFYDAEEKLSEKLLLFEHAKVLIYCADQLLPDTIIRQKFNGKLLAWSLEGNAPIQFIKTQGNSVITLTAIFPDTRFETNIPFQDNASITNLCHAIVAAYSLGIMPEQIKDEVTQLASVAMRLELKEGINNCLLIDDTYNADYDSLKIALQFLHQQSQKKIHTLILSDLLESEKTTTDMYSKVANLVNKYALDKIITIGEKSSVLTNLLSDRIAYRHFKSTKSFIQHFHSSDFNSEAILIKGARHFQFEKIVHSLSKNSHRTVLEINLSALIHNLNVYATLLRPGVKIMAMVKASAYGAGSDEVAKLLQYHKVDYLCVAYPDEGVELRKTGVTLPVMVLNPDESTLEVTFKYNLEPEIYSPGILQSLIGQMSSGVTALGVHIKLDTGMNRLGFSESDIDYLIEVLHQHPNIVVKSIFTHLAASEDPSQDEYTHKQATRFRQMAGKISAELNISPIMHILNSSGIGRFQEYQMDMVRLGIGLYGYDSNGDVGRLLRSVHSFKASISQIKTVFANETIGYGRKGIVTKTSKIATISVGYADGFRRMLGNGNYSVLINQTKVPTIGNVCMDMAMIDITDLKNVREGDEVIIFGEDLPVTEMAKTLQTIPYEVFTGISPRVKRIYYQD